MKLYHVTAESEIGDLMANGVPAYSRWFANEALARENVASVAEQGGSPAVVAAEFNAFRGDLMAPDTSGLTDREAKAVGKTADQVELALSSSARYGGRWEDSLETLGSLVYQGAMPADELVAPDKFDVEADAPRP